MNTYYEYIKTKIKGMISSAFLDLYEFELDFDSFIDHLVFKYGTITESNFDYHVFYNDDKINSQRDFTHYITLDNSIYIEIKTCGKCDIEKDIIDMKGSTIQNLISYSSQNNNKKLINFMNVVNAFVIKNKNSKDNA